MASRYDPTTTSKGRLASLAVSYPHVSFELLGQKVSAGNYRAHAGITAANYCFSNLSQARLGTLEEDLGMGGTDYNLATSILFVGYLLMQLPSNLLLTQVRPSLFLGIAMAIWYDRALLL